MSHLFIFTVTILSFTYIGSLAWNNPGCTININQDVSELLPLLLNSNGTYYLPYDSFGNITFAQNDAIYLACPGGNLILGKLNLESETNRIQCVQGKKFLFMNEIIFIDAIKCSKHPYHTARYSGNICLQNKAEIEVGFILSNQFLKTMEICFDNLKQTTLYSVATVSHAIGGYQSRYPRPKFIQDHFYKINSSLNNLYSRKNQRQAINTLLGIPLSSTKYIQNKGGFFLSRGHLTPKADFIYGSLQRSTFHFINVVPQWQSLNGGNWASLEKSIRDLAVKRSTDLNIITGTSGITTLPHSETGENIELYLYNTMGKKAIPVPHYIWKIVYNPKNGLGIAFVGLNNPYISQPSPCFDLCKIVKWLELNEQSSDSGYVYCCSVEELRNVLENIPAIPINGLLI